jgi:uncharacterized protein (DUF2236 family)
MKGDANTTGGGLPKFPGLAHNARMRGTISDRAFVTGDMAWRIHRERVLLAGWGRAILLQIAHPKVARGVAEHSAFTTEPWGRLRRLHRTLAAMLALTFGSEEEAAGSAARINAIHDRVHGRLEEPEGGAAYSAHDPELLAWVHAALIESFLLAYRLFVGPVTPAEADRYCLEASGIERALGIPSGRLPRREAELREYLDAMLASGAIAVTDTARRLSREILSPPAPVAVRPALWLAALPAVGLLPPAIRAAYGLRWDRRREHALRLLAVATRGGLPLVPRVLRYWAVARRAERRRRG